MSDEPSTTETEEAAETTGLSIDDAMPDTSVGGGELIPVSDAGIPKCMTVAQVKDYVLARIAALTAAGSASVSNDSVFILQGGVLKPVSASVLAAAIMNEAFGRAAVVGPNGNEVLAIKDSTERKTITFAALKAWLEDNITVTPDLTLADASNAGTLGDSDLALVVQAASGKKVTLATLKDYVLGKLAAFVTAATAAQSVSSTDVIYLVQGGNMRKATIEQLMAAAGGGDVTGPQTTTANKIPQWDSTAKKLKDGLELVDTINAAGGTGAPTDTQVPTAAAVRTAIDAVGQATNFVKKTGDESVAGTKTFTSSPLVPNVASTSDETQKAASTKWVADKLTAWWTAIKDAAQTISGVWTFLASPAVPTPMTSGTSSEVNTSDDTTKAANTAWVTAKIAAWWTAAKAAAQSISGVWTFSASPTVPAPTNDTDAANKKYVTDNAVFKTGDQTIAGAKTFSDVTALNGGATVPTGKALTITDAPSADTNAANKLYVDTAVATLRNELVTAGVLSAG